MGSQRKGSNDLYQYRDTDLDGKRHKAKKLCGWIHGFYSSEPI